MQNTLWEHLDKECRFIPVECPWCSKKVHNKEVYIRAVSFSGFLQQACKEQCVALIMTAAPLVNVVQCKGVDTGELWGLKPPQIFRLNTHYSYMGIHAFERY